MQNKIMIGVVPKYKNNPIAIIIQVFTFVGIFVQMFMQARNYYGILPFAQGGEEMIATLTPKALNTMIYVIIPLLSSALFYGIWTLFYRYSLSSAYRTMQVLGQDVNIDYARNVMSVIFGAGMILIGVAYYVFMLYPFVYILGYPITKGIIKATIVALYITIIIGKYDKLYKPVVAGSLLFPSIIIILIL